MSVHTTPPTPTTFGYPRPDRTEIIMFAITGGFFVIILAMFAASWFGRDAGLQMQVAGLGMSVMYVLCVWHAVVVKGVGPAIGFFVPAAVVTFAAEYVGDNFGWIFGDYTYTGALGPRLGGVPVLIIVVWGVVLYAGYMLVDWLVGAHGRRRGASWPATVLWNAFVAATTGLVMAAFDLLADPMAVSGVWQQVLGREPWWWWQGGSYLPDLVVWQGSGGIPAENFFGWWAVAAFIVFCYANAMAWWRPAGNRVRGRLLNALPLFIYAYMYVTMVTAVLVMRWHDPGLTQAAIIGTFTMGPVIGLGVTVLMRDLTSTGPDALVALARESSG